MIALDGTENKGRLGANAILGVSLAAAKAAADARGLPLYRYLGGVDANLLPVPMMNIINGGAHADNSIDLQEFMVMPVGAPTFAEALRCGAEIFHALKSALHRPGLTTAVGDEGGFAPNDRLGREALDLICEGDRGGRLQAGRRRAARARLRRERILQGRRVPHGRRGQDAVARPRMADFLAELAAEYPIVSIEDGMDEDDWEGWKPLTEKLGNRVQLVGDDLFVTNVKRLHGGSTRDRQFDPDQGQPDRHADRDHRRDPAGAEHRAIRRSSRTARARPRTRPSPTSRSRSSCGQIKTGSLARSDRMAKYNQLLRIEEELGDAARYAGPRGNQGLQAQLS